MTQYSKEDIFIKITKELSDEIDKWMVGEIELDYGYSYQYRKDGKDFWFELAIVEDKGKEFNIYFNGACVYSTEDIPEGIKTLLETIYHKNYEKEKEEKLHLFMCS